jgi:hypothetical protein
MTRSKGWEQKEKKKKKKKTKVAGIGHLGARREPRRDLSAAPRLRVMEILNAALR